jgi:hypothetical protein
MSKSARIVADWDFDRIVPCHGDVIEHGARVAWRKVYRDFLGSSGDGGGGGGDAAS